ncbi:ABC transporter permease [Flexithrix dorotheae]|uniref:ABC transporter permease n=1 Tax=Flexithrix dorotheae TaxID=70993 RepID=UPI000375FC41|nr:ABC transporter permease [Flexithrix dorotheae]
MFKNYIKLAYRSLLRKKAFSFINITGLVVGLVSGFLILEYVVFEYSFDSFHKKKSDIYRVINDRYEGEQLIQHGTITYSGIGPGLKEDFPEVVSNTRVAPIFGFAITHEDKILTKDNGLFVDTTFLEMFSFKMKAGDPNTALSDKNNIILTTKLAQKIFEIEEEETPEVIGKTIGFGRDKTPFKITGIIENPPQNSHLKFDCLVPYVTLINWWPEADRSYNASDFWHYIQLREGTDPTTLEAKLPAFSQRHFKGDELTGTFEKFSIQPLEEVRLQSDFEYEIGEVGNGKTVKILFLISILIMVIAWINYINLSTARAMERAKEVGVRKVIGARKTQLIFQFLGEALIVNFIALAIAIIIIYLIQPLYNNLLGFPLSISVLYAGNFAGWFIPVSLFLVWITGTLLSGFYPSLVLSSFKPVAILKGKFRFSPKGKVLRKFLVIGQFMVSTGLIMATLAVFHQVDFMQKQDLGINIEEVVVVDGPSLTSWDSTFIERSNTFKNELAGYHNIKNAATTNNVAGERTGRAFNVKRKGASDDETNMVSFKNVDFNYFDLFGVEILAGRNFHENDPDPDYTKVNKVILNESAVKLFGFESKEAAIGKELNLWTRDWEIIGVIEDYHQQSLKYGIEPFVFVPLYSTSHYFTFKINREHRAETMALIEDKFKTYFPGNAFEYFFLENRFNQLYSEDVFFGKVFILFSSLTIFIACLGLIGLTSYMVVQRNKEIGIRKVLGASIASILVLLSKEFLKLILIGFVIAIPVANYFITDWLDNFAYKIDIEWWLFAIPGIIVLCIAIASVFGQSIKAAIANPTDSLRSE